MNIQKVFICLCIIILSSSLKIVAQEININCRIKNGCGKYFRIEKTSDYITNTQKLLYSTIIDNSNNVKFCIHNEQTGEYTIYVDYAQGTVFLTPDAIYEISIVSPSYNPIQNPYTNPQYLSLDISSSEIDDINKLIDNFNTSYDNFLYKNYETILNGNSKLHNSFMQKTLLDINKYNNDFLISYVKYSFAITELSIPTISKTQLAEKYLYNSKVLFNSPMYIKFLTEFINTSSFNIDKSKTINAALIELTSICKLFKLYTNHTYSSETVANLLSKVEYCTKIPEIKVICNDLISSITAYYQGSNLPDISIRNKYNIPTNINLIDNNKKYLFFFKSSLRQNLSILDTLQKFDFKSHNITLIPICLDLDKKSSNLLTHYQNIYYPVNSIDAQEKFKIRAYPFAVIIDNKGKISIWNAPTETSALNKSLK